MCWEEGRLEVSEYESCSGVLAAVRYERVLVGGFDWSLSSSSAVDNTFAPRNGRF